MSAQNPKIFSIKSGNRLPRWIPITVALIMLGVGGGSQVLGLTQASGRALAKHRLAQLGDVVQSFNILGEIGHIQVSTDALLKVNTRVVASLNGMNQEELHNTQVLQSLQTTDGLLTGQAGILGRLDSLTAQQVPLSKWLTSTTGQLLDLMNQVANDTKDQRAATVQMNQLTAKLSQELHTITTLNQQMSQGPLSQAVTMTGQMAGR